MNIKSNTYSTCKNGFSLIELSIILIIISLMVSGVVAGASLIQSAKIRALNNELRNYKTQFYAFRIIHNRWPGDYDNTGWSGTCLGGGCPNAVARNSVIRKANYSAFGGEYNGIEVGYRAQPWVELYLEGISDFKPDINGDLSSDLLPEYTNKNFPCSKSFNGEVCFVELDIVKDFYHSAANFFAKSIKDDSILITLEGIDNFLSTKIIKNIDQKFDDGVANTGLIRTNCYKNGAWRSYDHALENNYKCEYSYYILE